MRVATYSRFSSENQSQASITDQREICRRYADQRGWSIVASYEDAAISGASRFRPGYLKLLSELDQGGFDAILVESLDRLGRKLADVADLHDRCAFAGIKLIATNVGEITQMHVGMLGTMAQLYLSDLREKTWRGQLGRALQGKSPGGKAFGYDIIASGGRNEAGERRINLAEAAIVQRIFQEFASGVGPRKIASKLNADGIPGPGGRPWGDTTIRGQVDRGTGILNNPTYVGRLEWNKCAYTKDPRTGKRVARPNPRGKWEIAQVPELRIVGDELWDLVKARQQAVRIEIGRDERGNALNRARRRQFLLSGLLVCGQCGGTYIVIGQDRYGCGVHRSKGTCSNNLQIERTAIEQRVLDGLKDRLMAPELVEEFVREFNAELRQLASSADTDRKAAVKAVADAERKISAIVRAIEDGAYNAALKARLTTLEIEKETAATNLAKATAPSVVRLHPNLPELYRTKVARLEELMNEPATAAQAREIVRGLIDRIVLTPSDGMLSIELHGDLAVLAGFAHSSERTRESAGSKAEPALLSVVAGRGFEPLTFRL